MMDPLKALSCHCSDAVFSPKFCNFLLSTGLHCYQSLMVRSTSTRSVMLFATMIPGPEKQHGAACRSPLSLSIDTFKAQKVSGGAARGNTALLAGFLTSAGHVLTRGQVPGASTHSPCSRVACPAPVYMVYIHDNHRIPGFSRPAQPSTVGASDWLRQASKFVKFHPDSNSRSGVQKKEKKKQHNPHVFP